jgi:BASS family bile acid:Na+ symporter
MPLRSHVHGEVALSIFVTVFLPMTLFVIMFSLGLSLVIGDFSRVVTHPKAFAVGIFAQMIMLPAIGFLLAVSLNLTPELALGLVILALCPGGATANIFTRLGHGDVALSIAVMSVSTLLAAFTMPVMAKLMAGYFLNLEAGDVDVTALSLSMLMLTVLPVSGAMTIRHFYPGFAAAIERSVARLALFLVVVVVGVVLATNWGMFIENLPILGPSVLTLNALVLIAGLLVSRLFSLPEEQATAVALETGIKNAALGVTVGSMLISNGGGEVSPISVPSGVYGITMYAMCVAFMLWRRSRWESGRAATA